MLDLVFRVTQAECVALANHVVMAAHAHATLSIRIYKICIDMRARPSPFVLARSCSSRAHLLSSYYAQAPPHRPSTLPSDPPHSVPDAAAAAGGETGGGD
jgi:hypothetical protein